MNSLEAAAVVALTEPGLFSRWWHGEQRALETVPDLGVEWIGRHDIVLVGPETGNTGGAHLVVKWKREQAAVLARTKLIFCTYKGFWHYRPEYDGHVAGWVIHAKSYSRSERMHYVPLALKCAPPGEGKRGDYIFVGGRKERDFRAAAAALRGKETVFVSDRVPALDPQKGHKVIRDRVSKEEYRALMEGAKMVVVPLERGGFPHGHSDVVRAFFAGKPVVVTGGASCDDYIVEGKNGVLCGEGAGAMRMAVEAVLENLDEMRAYCREAAWRPHTEEAYVRGILAVIAKVRGRGVAAALEG